MKDAAEACRRSADEGRKLACSVSTATERETFQRLADGFDFLADHLSQIGKHSCDGREFHVAPQRVPCERRGRHLEH
jgi:hypothetical protein